jgi:hypothetical protein
MKTLINVLPTATETPSPEFDPATMTPGPIGFTVFALIAIAVILLILDMNRRIRRVRYRAEAAELAALLDEGTGPDDKPTAS